MILALLAHAAGRNDHPTCLATSVKYLTDRETCRKRTHSDTGLGNSGAYPHSVVQPVSKLIFRQVFGTSRQTNVFGVATALELPLHCPPSLSGRLRCSVSGEQTGFTKVARPLSAQGERARRTHFGTATRGNAYRFG